MGRGEPIPGWSTADQSQWRTVCESLQAGQYERLAELLRDVQVAIECREDTIQAQMLVLARRICLACSQSHTEAEWHQQARQEAMQREQKLKHQLYTLFDLLSERSPSQVLEGWAVMPDDHPVEIGPPAPGLPGPTEQLSLWQRILGMLSWRLGSPPLESVAPKPTAQDSTPPHRDIAGISVEIAEQATHRTKRPEVSAIPPRENVQKITLPSLEESTPSIVPQVKQTETPAETRPAESRAPEPYHTEDADQVRHAQPHFDGSATAAIGQPEPSVPLRSAVPENLTAPTVGQLTPPPSTAPDALDKPIPGAVADEARQDMPSLAIHCLGPFRVYQDDQPVVEWPSSKGKAVLKYLVTHRERPIPKEILMELFWPDAHPDAARNNLNVAIYGLRQALRQVRPEFSHVLFQEDCYLLNPDLTIWVDVEEFQEHSRIARDLERSGDLSAAIRECCAAEALYQGQFLEEDRYEDWPIPLRQDLQESFLALLRSLSRYCLEQGDLIACATVCRRMLAVDACNECAHRRLMRCYSRQGQRYLALRQYHLCVEALREELDVSPALATIELYERIRHHQQI